MRKKLVFFGGTFDPPHIEHINMVKAVKKEINPDKIIIMPTFIPPHKKVFMTATASDRLKMCELAFGDIGDVEISDWEIRQKGKSFSCLTVKSLAEKHKGYDILFLMGTDMISTFHKWKNPTEILKYSTPLLCVRDGENISVEESENSFLERFGVKIKTLDYIGKNLSSTKIKIKKLLKQDTSNILKDSVDELIDRLFLYNDGKRADFLINNLSKERIVHTEGVMALSIKYAKMLGVNLNKAIKASMYHDVAKNLDPTNYQDFKMPKGVPKPVVHQYLGAYVCEKILGITDRQVLNAVKYHTSGKPKMSKLAKVVYLADMLEEGRTYEGVEKTRELSFKDFDKAFILSLDRSIEHVLERGYSVYPLTLKAREYYKNLYENS